MTSPAPYTSHRTLPSDIMRSARRSPTASTIAVPTTASSAWCRPPHACSQSTSLEAWRKPVGSKRYPRTRTLFITADSGGRNGYRSQVWKHELHQLADMSIRVSHFLPGTSEWNKVEHRPFSFTSSTGAADHCGHTRHHRPHQQRVTEADGSWARDLIVALSHRQERSATELLKLTIERDEFRGDWTYVIHPRDEMR